MESSRNQSSQTFSDIINKLNSLQEKISGEGVDRTTFLSEPKHQHDVLRDLSRRYNPHRSTSDDIMSKNHKKSSFESGFNGNTLNIPKNVLSDIHSVSNKLLKNIKSSNMNESKFLNDFFGFSIDKSSNLEFTQIENKTVPFSEYKKNIISKLDSILNENFIRNMSKNISTAKMASLYYYSEEWAYLKTCFSSEKFKVDKQPRILWDLDIQKKAQKQDIQKIQEQLYSKIRLINLEPVVFDKGIGAFFATDSLDITMGQRNLLNSAIQVAEFLCAEKFNAFNRDSLDFETKTIDFALKFMAKSFVDYIKLYNQPQTSSNRLGFSNNSSLDSINLIHAFYKQAKFAGCEENNSDKVNDIPVWFLIYNLVKMQDYSSAISVVERLDPTYRIIMNILKNLDSNQELALTREDIDDINRLVKSRLRQSTDAYERLILSLFTFSHVENSSLKPLDTIEEFVWFKLLRLKLSMLLNPNTIGRPRSTIEAELAVDFQNDDNISSSILFSQSVCFFVVGAIERGIEFLCRDDIGIIFAVHIAIIFWNRGLICATALRDKPILIINEEGEFKKGFLNIHALLNKFLMRSPITHDISILEYFISFHDVKSDEGDILSFGADSLITKFSQFENIISIGCLESSDTIGYNPAYLQSVSSLADYCTLAHENVIALAIYIKIGNHKKAIDCMSDILIDLIICPNSYSKATIKDIENHGKFLGNKVILDSSIHDFSSNKLLLLLDLTLFFKEFRASRYVNSLKIINALKIVPVKYSQINQCLEKLNSYPRKFIYIFRLVLVSTVLSIKKIHDTLKSDFRKTSSNDTLILREQASAILSFTAQLPFPLPRDIRAQILADLSDIRKQT